MKRRRDVLFLSWSTGTRKVGQARCQTAARIRTLKKLTCNQSFTLWVSGVSHTRRGSALNISLSKEHACMCSSYFLEWAQSSVTPNSGICWSIDCFINMLNNIYKCWWIFGIFAADSWEEAAEKNLGRWNIMTSRLLWARGTTGIYQADAVEIKVLFLDGDHQLWTFKAIFKYIKGTATIVNPL